MKTFYSNGKLLLTSEYLVLDGAIALAIPTKFGQHLTVKELDESKLIWKSLDETGAIWFEYRINIEDLAKDSSRVLGTTDEISARLLLLLSAAKKLNPSFLNRGYEVITTLNFPRNWGLGSSSTLINNLAQWSHVNPFELLHLTFGGSGYDIACAQNNTPISYQLIDSKRVIHPIHFNPPYKEHIFFVYLNRKQNSRESIATYKEKVISNDAIKKASRLTHEIIKSRNLEKFCELIDRHETLIGNLLNITPVKQQLFHDFKGSIKSLGGWGGDFVLVASHNNPKVYFRNKGFETIIPYKEMVLD